MNLHRSKHCGMQRLLSTDEVARALSLKYQCPTAIFRSTVFALADSVVANVLLWACV